MSALTGLVRTMAGSWIAKMGWHSSIIRRHSKVVDASRGTSDELTTVYLGGAINLSLKTFPNYSATYGIARHGGHEIAASCENKAAAFAIRSAFQVFAEAKRQIPIRFYDCPATYYIYGINTHIPTTVDVVIP